METKTVMCLPCKSSSRFASLLAWGMLVLTLLPNQAVRAQPASFAWARSVDPLAARTWFCEIATDTAGNGFVAVERRIVHMSPEPWDEIHAINKFDSQGHLLWERTIDTAGALWGTAVTADGGCSVIGYTANGVFTNLVLTPEGSGEVFLAKYNSGGDLLAFRRTRWGLANPLGGYVLGNVALPGVKLDRAGNVYAAASYKGSPTFAGVSLPMASTDWSAALVAKFAPDGSPIWVRAVKGGNLQNGGQMAPFGYLAVDSSGNVFAAVTSSGARVTFEDTTASGSPCFIAKYDSNGNLAWAKPVLPETPANGGYMPDVAVDQGGNAFTLAWFRSPELWSIAKWSPTGELLWQHINQARGEGAEIDHVARPKVLAVDPFGNVVAAVSFIGGPLLVGSSSFPNLSPLFNLATLKFSPSGDLLWGLLPEPEGEVWPMGLAADPNGGYWLSSAAWQPVRFGDTVLEPIERQDVLFLTRIVDNDTTVPRPALQIARAAGRLTLSWPGTATGYELQRSASLSNPMNWVGLLDPSAISNTNSVQVSPTNASAFYRLRQR